MKKIVCIALLALTLSGCAQKKSYTINLPDSTPDPNVSVPAF